MLSTNSQPFSIKPFNLTILYQISTIYVSSNRVYDQALLHFLWSGGAGFSGDEEANQPCREINGTKRARVEFPVLNLSRRLIFKKSPHMDQNSCQSVLFRHLQSR